MDHQGSGAISIDEVEDLLHDTYGFPPLEEEVALFIQAFELNHEGLVTWEEFKTTL
jgi:Ca2+-binding EF-hand superfamily protein